MHYYVIHDENTCIIFIFRNSGEILINSATLHFLAAHIKTTRNFHAFLVSPQKNSSFIQGFRICIVIEHKAATIDIIKWIPVAMIFISTRIWKFAWWIQVSTHQNSPKLTSYSQVTQTLLTCYSQVTHKTYLQNLLSSACGFLTHEIPSERSNYRSIKNPCNWNPLFNVNGSFLMLNNNADSEALNKTAFFLRTDPKCVEITSRFYV